MVSVFANGPERKHLAPSLVHTAIEEYDMFATLEP